MPPAFGQWLKQRRAALGLTQEALAQQAICSVSLVRKYESGARHPPHQTAVRLAEVLQIDPSQREQFIDLALLDSLHKSIAEPHVAPGWLPASPTPLFGRKADVEVIGKRLLGSHGRLVTLLGPPGVGKTRLGIEAADALRLEFPDGVWFVALAPLDQAALVAATITRTLKLAEPRDGDYLRALVAFLRAQHTLLVLDNCEHVLAAATLVAALLESCPHLHIIATSRAPLKLRAEHRFAVRPLPLPQRSTLDDVAAAPATALFSERAEAVAPEFALDDANAATVAAICAHLDGLPLAIELAAARADTFAPDALLAQLEQRFALLADGPRDLPQRQQTLYSAIAWSYGLLDADEQRSFARLGVFAGGCTVEAAAAVGAAHLERLREKSLVQRQRGADGEVRYVLLETLREFALARLAQHDDPDETQARHMRYFAQIAAQAEPALRGTESPRWLQRLDADLDNLRAAMGFSLEHDGDATTGRIASALLNYWRSRGLYGEGQRWLDRAIEAENALGLAERAKALYVVAFLRSQQGHPQTIAAFEQSLAISRAIGDNVGAARVLTQLGMMARYPGNHDRTLALLNESVARLRTVDEPYALSIALNQIGMALIERGDYAEAEIVCAESMQHARSFGADRQAFLSELSLAEAIRWQGDDVRAATHYSAGLAFAQRTGDRELRAEALNGLGQIAMHTGNLADAQTYHTESLTLYRDMHIPYGIIIAQDCLTYLALAREDIATAERWTAENVPLAAESFYVECFARGLIAQSVIATERQQHKHAARLLGTAAGLAQQFCLRADPAAAAFALRATAAAHAQLGVAFAQHYEQMLALVCARIPTVRFSDAYQAVQSINLAEVVAATTAQP